MATWFKSNASTIWSWAALIAAAIIIFVLSIGTGYQPLGISLLLSAVTLLVAMAIFEVIWQFAARLFGEGQTAGRPNQGPRR